MHIRSRRFACLYGLRPRTLQITALLEVVVALTAPDLAEPDRDLATVTEGAPSGCWTQPE
jgi:hypothetical protein